MRLLFIVLLWTWLVVQTAAADAPLARVAVVGDADSQGLSALVTAELTASGTVEVVEREDLAKVGDELRLRALAAGQPLELGKLLRADGLVFVGKVLPAGTAVRFTGVGLGYALFDAPLAPGTDPAVAARAVAQRVRDYLPKLRLAPGKSLPISVLNLRCDLATPRAAEVERSITLLLESQLSAVPEYVVLERRHAGALGFERALDPAARPLLTGSYLVDGTLTLPPSGAGEVTTHLRLVSPGDRPQALEVRGGIDDLPALAEKLAAAIRQATGHAADPGVWQPEKEAHEYLLEACWAWKHRLHAAAWEAADSAGLLGEKSADYVALRVNLLLARARNYTGGRSSDRQAAVARTPEACADDLLQAITEATRYTDEHLEGKLKLYDPRVDMDVRFWEMHKECLLLGTDLIPALDKAGSPRADDVRRAMRVFSHYDPLNGKPGTHSAAYPWLQPEVYTDCWALTLEEALASLRLSCSEPGGYATPRLIRGQGRDFCPRFLHTPEAQASAFRDFVAGLRNDPATRLAALVIDTGSPQPADADAACRAYVEALWPLREALCAPGSHRREWTDLGGIPEPVRQRQAKLMIPLLRYYLTHAESFEFGTFCIRRMWVPSAWSADEAAAVWTDYQVCKARMEQDRAKRGRNVSWLNSQEGELEDPVLARFPALRAIGGGQGPALPVTRFWDLWRAPGALPKPLRIIDADLADDGLCVLGEFEGGGVRRMALYRVALPGFKAEAIPLPSKEVTTWRSLEITPGGIDVDYFVLDKDPADEPHRLGHFDRARRTWSDTVVKPREATFQRVGGDTFVHLPGLLARLDPATGQLDPLISDRRKPPRNPLDAAPYFRSARVFTGPGGRPCITALSGTFYVQSEPGDWTPVFDGSENASSITRHGQTVVVSWAGEAVLIDPARKEPEYLMAPPDAHFRKHPADGQPPGPSMTPWYAQTYWDPPGREPGAVEMSSAQIAWAEGRFFVLSLPKGKSQHYELIAYTKEGGRKPCRVPLEFHLDKATRQELTPIFPGKPSSDGTVDDIEHPSTTFFELKPLADRQGLWLYSRMGGVWYIPYAELDEYRKTHPPDPAPDATPGSSPAAAATPVPPKP